MKLALFLVIVAGAAIGFMLPSGSSDTPATPPSSPHAYRETLLDRRMDGHFYVDAEVNGGRVRFLVDTGATTVALTMDDARKVGITFDPSKFTVVGQGASGDVIGQFVTLDFVDIEGKRVPHITALVGQDLPVSLLGQAYLTRISGVQLNGDRMVLR